MKARATRSLAGKPFGVSGGRDLAVTSSVRCPSCDSDEVDQLALKPELCLVVLRCRRCETQFARATEPRGRFEIVPKRKDKDE
jgi:hypothetical protein